MQTYTLRGIQSMLGLSRGVIAGLIAAGFVTPSRGTRNEYRFSFQDVVLLRTAHSLQAAQDPAAQDPALAAAPEGHAAERAAADRACASPRSATRSRCRKATRMACRLAASC